MNEECKVQDDVRCFRSSDVNLSNKLCVKVLECAVSMNTPLSQVIVSAGAPSPYIACVELQGMLT